MLLIVSRPRGSYKFACMHGCMIKFNGASAAAEMKIIYSIAEVIITGKECQGEKELSELISLSLEITSCSSKYCNYYLNHDRHKSCDQDKGPSYGRAEYIVQYNVSP